MTQTIDATPLMEMPLDDLRALIFRATDRGNPNAHGVGGLIRSIAFRFIAGMLGSTDRCTPNEAVARGFAMLAILRELARTAE